MGLEFKIDTFSYIKVLRIDKNIHRPLILFRDNSYDDLNYMFNEKLKSISQINSLVDEIIRAQRKKEKVYFADNEIQIAIGNQNTKYHIFENTFITSTEYFLLLLEDWKNFLSDYFSGKIPGIIPESKLDNWTCVPKEYVKEEYWKKKEKGEF